MHASIVVTDPARADSTSDIVLAPAPLAAAGRNEAWLRDFLLAHPATLPTGHIDLACADAIPVRRELRIPAGPMDCLFVTRFGGLIVAECKLCNRGKTPGGMSVQGFRRLRRP